MRVKRKITENNFRKSGFTIVELLIVIVVIAVLAAISIVAFNGIQQRARNTARLQAAANIYKQLEMYTQQTGAGFGNGNGTACLPTEANYDSGNGGTLDCYVSGGVWSENTTTTSTLTNAGLKFSYPNLPIQEGSIAHRGIAIGYLTGTNQGMNGMLRPFVLVFKLEGSDQDCGPNSVRNSTNPDPLYSIVPAKYYLSYSTVTMCTLSLTHHSNL